MHYVPIIPVLIKRDLYFVRQLAFDTVLSYIWSFCIRWIARQFCNVYTVQYNRRTCTSRGIQWKPRDQTTCTHHILCLTPARTVAVQCCIISPPRYPSLSVWQLRVDHVTMATRVCLAWSRGYLGSGTWDGKARAGVLPHRLQQFSELLCTVGRRVVVYVCGRVFSDCTILNLKLQGHRYTPWLAYCSFCLIILFSRLSRE